MATKTKIISFEIYTLHCNYRLLGTFALSLPSIALYITHVYLSSDNSVVKGLSTAAIEDALVHRHCNFDNLKMKYGQS